VEVVATGLQIPWAVAFAPDGRLFFTERPGRIRVMLDGRLQADPVAVLPVATVGEGGLMGLAFDPGFPRNPFLYVMYTHGTDGAVLNRISRLRLTGNKAAEEKVLVEGIPGASNHDGGRLHFGPDGKLYATAGDASHPELAQDRASPAGKLLRMNADGGVPADNPFPGSLVYSMGHRNAQGFDWQPGTGRLFATEHGPTSNDKVNRIDRGANYGWPRVQGAQRGPGFVPAVKVFNPTTCAPSGATFYDARLIPQWRGSFFFTCLRGHHLHRLVFTAGGDGIVDEEEIFADYGRLRDVVVGPEGALYFATNNRDGRGTPGPEDDRILRIVRR
jgi:glucose/arabinose dehydrogenase